MTRSAGAIAAALVLSACGHQRVPLDVPWAPDAQGWDLRDVDPSEPPTWMVYERDAEVADVKEFRIVGTVDAQPAATMEAYRERLVDDRYLPDGLERRFLTLSDTEIVHYGRMPVPFPMKDREATERLVFTVDPATDTHAMDCREVPQEPSDAGVLPIPVVRNRYVVTPLSVTQSVVVNDTIHDIGGSIPNWVLYGPIRQQLVEDLYIVRGLVDQGRGGRPPDASAGAAR